MDKKICWISVVVFIILALVAGFFIGRKYPSKNNTFQAGWIAAKNKLESSGVFKKGMINLLQGNIENKCHRQIAHPDNLGKTIFCQRHKNNV